MEIRVHEGQQVQVNLAPFIGWQHRSRQSVACRVIAVRGDSVHVSTLNPCRQVTMWVQRSWVEAEPAKRAALLSTVS
jgi:hypothetical protein